MYNNPSPRPAFSRVATAISLAAMLITPLAHAGSIAGVRVDPPTIVVGQPVQVTIDGQDEGHCGLRLEYGNGDVDVTGMREGKDRFPRIFTHTYAGPGTFTLIAKGGRDGTAMGCSGEARTTLTVMPAPVAEQRRMRPQCPEGFAFNRNSFDRRTGAYTCAALQGAELPQVGMACPDGTAYYTNIQGTMAGCKALRRQQ